MILRGLGVDVLAQLMSLDRRGDSDSWLLFGPSSEDVVQAIEDVEAPPDEMMRWAAE